MSSSNKCIEAFINAYRKYQSIDNERDLINNGLSLSDYYILSDVMSQLNKKDCEGVWCISDNVAKWCNTFGLYVTYSKALGAYNSVNYWISVSTPLAKIS